MPRTKSNPVGRMFFHYNLNTNESTCQVPNCKNPVRTGNHSGNLENHIKQFHKEQYGTLLREKEKNNSTYPTENCSTTNKRQKIEKTGPLDKMIIISKKTLTNVKLDKKTVVDACVQLVTTNGRPFQLLDDSGFRMIMNPIFNAIGDGFRMNSNNIKKHINEHAESIIKSIKADIDKKLISLKVDCVTRLNRSIIGVNIQYFKDEKLNIKTIGMTELFNRHTSEYLKQVLINILRKYNIDNRQVFSITCDNGANIVKMVRILNDTDEVHEDDGASSESDLDEIESPISGDTDYLTESQLNTVLLEGGDFSDFSADDLQNEIVATMSCNEQDPLTQCVRCSAHTLQLCIDNGLKVEVIKKLLTKARKVVKVLRTQSYAALLKKDCLKQAVLDNSTRWDTTYLMLIRLYEL
ncbi:zinc finger BED domain-containing protein RICESLEEPER 1-like isoform X1, partial [Aphis craccivora]